MDLKCTYPGKTGHPATIPEPSDRTEEPILSEQWPAASRRQWVVDDSAFFRLPPRGEFKIISGYPGGPIVVCGDSARRSSPAADRDDGYVSKARAEVILEHGRGYLSRKKEKNSRPMWEELGFTPRRSGNKLLFKKADLYAHLERQIVKKRGRPRSIPANVA